MAEQAQRDTTQAVDYLTDTYTRLIRISGARRDEALRSEALRTCEQAAALTSKLLDAHPSTTLRSSLAKILTHQSVLQASAGQRQEALSSAARALDLLRDLSTDEAEGFPTPDWGETCFVLGGVFMNLDQPGDSNVPFTQAVRHFRKSLDAAPGDAKLREALSKSYFHLGEVQRRTGRIEAAGTTAWTRLQLWPSDPDQIYDVACELARCSAASAGRSPLTEQQAEARDRFAAAAVEVLHKAVAAGFKDVKGLKADRDLVPLHGREDYERLVAELEKK
jgi:tetratricopeptide (TPR) repeat protein